MSELETLIRHESPALVAETLDFLLNECSMDEQPGRSEVQHWLTILETRGRTFKRAAEICRTFLAETTA